MGEKVKKVFAVIGAVFTIVVCTVLLLLRRRDSDGQRSGRIDEYDTRIQEGIAGCEERIGTIEEHITSAENGVERCEERLRRAEEILRNAIRRSREGESGSKDLASDNSNE